MKPIPILLFIIVVTSCDVHDDRLKVLNLSDVNISLSTEKDTIPEYPSVDKTEYHLRSALYPEEEKKLLYEGQRKGWSFFIADSKNEKLNLFVYNIDSMGKYKSIDTLIRKQIYTRYSFTEQELDEMDWQVIIKD